MTQSYDLDLFADTASWYRRYRAPYAPAALEHARAAFGLDGTGRVLDLGCGPGILSVPFSRWAAEVVAMDPDPGMLAEGRRYAAEAGGGAITWIQGGSLELSPARGRFRAVLLGQSFHWMDRDPVLAALHPMIEDGGGIALINPGRRRPQESWEPVTEPIKEAYLGPPQHHPQRNLEGPHEPALRRSAFTITEDLEFATGVERTAEAVIGVYYSSSGARKALFGERAPAFEADVRAALALGYPPVWTETVETGVLIARKR
jgi:SAM-dependent methyltransferase